MNTLQKCLCSVIILFSFFISNCVQISVAVETDIVYNNYTIYKEKFEQCSAKLEHVTSENRQVNNLLCFQGIIFSGLLVAFFAFRLYKPWIAFCDKLDLWADGVADLKSTNIILNNMRNNRDFWFDRAKALENKFNVEPKLTENCMMSRTDN